MTSGSDVLSENAVRFPTSEEPIYPLPQIQPHLPFRRISLPTAPTLDQRQSVISVASFGSLPEESEALFNNRVKMQWDVRTGTARPVSIDSPRRKVRRRDTSVRPVDEAKDAKRRKVVQEIYETEGAYVDGLEMIYTHFLTPIILSLDTAHPLLDRSSLTSVFSNFIDIWNLHRSFFLALTTLLSNSGFFPSSSSTSTQNLSTPPISPVLLAHFPYLSLYGPFVTAFPTSITTLTELTSTSTSARPNAQYSPAFARFLKARESDPRCGKLKLRDWLLTIVQRCPRYLLLLKDLIGCVELEDPEHEQLTAAYNLVFKITNSLNTSLEIHVQTLALLALQRATSNLPFQLIVPGRSLIKRGPLIQVERSDTPREREFLLFSDCFVWLANEELERGSWGIPWSSSSSNANEASSSPISRPASGTFTKPPPLLRSRSKSEAEAPTSMLRRRLSSKTALNLSPPLIPRKQKPYNHSMTPQPPMALKHHSARSSTAGSEDRWIYKGRTPLVDIEIVVTNAREDEEDIKWEVLSPEGSFVLYAATSDERNEWTSAIRQAKSQLMVSLNVTNPNSTLTSSASTNHVRRSLQALPFHPSDDRIATLRGSPGTPGKNKIRKERKKHVKDDAMQHRHLLDENDQAILKDRETDDGSSPEQSIIGKSSASKASERRGKVEHWVPAIWIPDEKTDGCMRCGRPFGWRRRRHHCRLCGRCVCAACSERTFFITDPNAGSSSSAVKPARACDACYETVFPVIDMTPSPSPTSSSHPDFSSILRGTPPDTITTLSNIPSWLSMPSLPVQKPRALMDLDATYDHSFDPDVDDLVQDKEEWDRGRVRIKPPHHPPRSYHQILEDFAEQTRDMEAQHGLSESPSDEGGARQSLSDNEEACSELQEQKLWFIPTTPTTSSPVPSPKKRREDTARRVQRFSLPAVAIQTTSVTARTSVAGVETLLEANSAKTRFSLVLESRNSHQPHQGGADNERERGGNENHLRGVAVGKLNQLLGRKAKG